MKFFHLVLVIYILAGCSSAEQAESADPLTGTWVYADCRIKNTSVRGTITFRRNGTFKLDAKARDDYPVGSICGVYSYRLNGSMILTEYTKGYGMSLYYYINGDELFFLDIPPAGKVETGDWKYRLRRDR